MILAVVASVYVPVAVKLVVYPFATTPGDGVIPIAVNVGAVTVSVALLDVLPLSVAVTLDAPCSNVDATPLVLTVATLVLLDAQVTDPEIFPVLASE